MMSITHNNVYNQHQVERLAEEFARLKDKTYLDHAGATLYAKTQITNATNDLLNNLYSNPHTSKHTADCIDQVRFQVLNHFNTHSNEYTVIFTSGATAALKIIAEAFDYKSQENKTNGCFSYLQDNHTSVLGMREVATAKMAEVVCIPHDTMLTIMSDDNQMTNQTDDFDAFESLQRGIFVYPAQCNFSGYKYPLEWIEKIRSGSLNTFVQSQINKNITEWSVILDAASFVSTNKLDLSVYNPDFVSISFYKIFGYPTGLGALLVRNSSVHLLEAKKYYGGGSVEIAMSGKNFHIKRRNLYERFEDGTISFLSIMAIKHGFNILNELLLSSNDSVMNKISLHTFQLAKSFYDQLISIKHFNNKPIAHIYSDTTYTSKEIQGGIVNFNLMRPNGDYIGYAEVIHMAELFDILIRSGCFCNPGACQRFLKLSNEELLKHYKAGHVCGDNNDLIDGVPTGSLRVSFGYMSTMKDVESIISMIKKCFVDSNPQKHISNRFAKLTFNESDIRNDYDNNKLKSKGILKEIHIFPLKSCGAFKIYDLWEVGPKGFKYDREWMIIMENGVALTQKQDTRMCIIQPSINILTNELVLSFPGMESIKISLLQSHNDITESSLCRSKVCGDKIQGYDCGNKVADWLLKALGIPGLRLIRQSDDFLRMSNNNVDTPISLSNKAQYLAVNLASVKWLSSKVSSQEFDDRIDNLTARFRGNLIIETATAFEELTWKSVKINHINFEMNGPCTRCQMICIDQESGEKTIEPLSSISKLFEGKIHFGAYFSHCGINNADKNYLQCGDIVYANGR